MGENRKYYTKTIATSNKTSSLCNACGLHYHRNVQRERQIRHSSTPNSILKILNNTPEVSKTQREISEGSSPPSEPDLDEQNDQNQFAHAD